MSSRDLRLPKLRASATFAPATVDAEARRVEVRWYSGATVERVPLFADPYRLRFDMKGAKLERLNAGAPLLAAHNDTALDGVLGVVERAWIAADGGHAIVRFSDRAEVEPIFGDVRSGVLRNVSMGAVIHELTDSTPKGAPIRELLATSWEPHELSLVPIAADPRAQTLNSDGDTFPCRLTTEATNMDLEREHDGGEPELTPKQELAELRRRERIRHSAAAYSAGDLVAQRLIASGASVETALDQFAAERAAREPKTVNDLGHGYVAESWDRGPRKLERLAGGIAAHALGREPTEPEREFREFGFVDGAREVLKAEGKLRGRDARVTRRS